MILGLRKIGINTSGSLTRGQVMCLFGSYGFALRCDGWVAAMTALISSLTPGSSMGKCPHSWSRVQPAGCGMVASVSMLSRGGVHASHCGCARWTGAVGGVCW